MSAAEPFVPGGEFFGGSAHRDASAISVRGDAAAAPETYGHTSSESEASGSPGGASVASTPARPSSVRYQSADAM